MVENRPFEVEKLSRGSDLDQSSEDGRPKVERSERGLLASSQ